MVATSSTPCDAVRADGTGPAGRSKAARRLLGPALAAAALAVAALIAAVPAGAPAAADEPVDPSALAATRLLVTYDAPVTQPEVALAGAGVGAAQLRAPSSAPSAVQVLEFSTPAEAAQAAARLQRHGDVVAVEPDRHIPPLTPRLASENALPDPAPADIDLRSRSTLDAAVHAAHGPAHGPTHGPGAGPKQGPPPGWPASWGVHNDGSRIDGLPGRPRVDVGAAQAWPLATGRGVVVAVIDSGVDISHPWLAERLWHNPGERVDGRDTSGSGYLDDVHGWNFYDRNAQLFVDAEEDLHGTHVAGIIVGAPEPRSRFVGVAPDARVMVLKVMGPQGSTTSLLIEALRYARDNGADLVNLSLNTDAADRALRTALAELEIPVVNSAGNGGERFGSPVEYPAAFGLPTVLGVAAVDHAGRMPRWSSRDRRLADVAAPGAAIPSTVPGGFGVLDGTSMAAPHVAGVLALALERHPDVPADVLVQAVRDTVRPLDGAAETRAGGIVRAPALLDALGTRVPACDRPPAVPFGDVTRTGAHHDAIACLLARGVTRGTSATTYGGADPLTHAQIATLVANALEPTGALPPVPAVGRFRDLDGNLHRDNVERLAAIDVVRGVDHDRYDPGETVTRAQFAAVVVRAAEWLADGEVRAVGPAFTDTRGHPDVAEIDRAAGLRIVTGRAPGVFDPDAPLRRDQAASMVTRLLNTLVQQGLLEAA